MSSNTGQWQGRIDLLKAGRGHATPHIPVQRAKCWRLLKIEPNAWAGGKAALQSALTFKL